MVKAKSYKALLRTGIFTLADEYQPAEVDILGVAAVVHRTIDERPELYFGHGWTVTDIQSGVAFCVGCSTRRGAVARATRLLKANGGPAAMKELRRKVRAKAKKMGAIA